MIILGYRSNDGQIHPLLKERLDTALRVMKKNRFRYVILSGGAVGSNVTEADLMYDYLLAQGVPAEKLLREAKSRNTVQNIVNCKQLMCEYGLETCLLVSNSFHIRRMKYILRNLGIPAVFYAGRGLAALHLQWRITFQEIRAFKLTLPWIEKVLNQKEART